MFGDIQKEMRERADRAEANQKAMIVLLQEILDSLEAMNSKLQAACNELDSIRRNQ